MANGRPGRPSKLTVALLNTLCAHLREGQPKRSAAALVGVHRDTMNRWEQLGRAARAKRDEGLTLNATEDLYLRAVEEIELAWDFGEGWLMQQGLKAARGEIKARATDFVMLLERTRPDQWRRRSSAEYVDRGKEAPNRRVDVSKLDKDERQSLRELLAKARADDDA